MAELDCGDSFLDSACEVAGDVAFVDPSCEPSHDDAELSKYDGSFKLTPTPNKEAGIELFWDVALSSSEVGQADLAAPEKIEILGRSGIEYDEDFDLLEVEGDPPEFDSFTPTSFDFSCWFRLDGSIH